MDLTSRDEFDEPRQPLCHVDLGDTGVVEGVHRHLSSGFPDGLGGDGADRLQRIDARVDVLRLDGLCDLGGLLGRDTLAILDGRGSSVSSTSASISSVTCS